MNRDRIRFGARFLAAILAGLAFTEVNAERLALEAKSPSQKRESLIWNVNQQITKIQVDVLGGRPIVNTIKFLGGPEFNVGSYIEKGQNWNHDLDSATMAGQIRVNVDQAIGSQVRLIVWTGASGNVTRDSNSGDTATKRPTNKKESLIWEVHDSIRGFEVSVTEGRPIINTVKLLGGEEFTVGAYFEKGQSFRKDFDSSVQVGQLRVNVDKAIGSELKLFVHK